MKHDYMEVLATVFQTNERIDHDSSVGSTPNANTPTDSVARIPSACRSWTAELYYTSERTMWLKLSNMMINPPVDYDSTR
jgi:hypothetical protein